MESQIAPKFRLLKRFDLWTVSPSYEHPGCCLVTRNRSLDEGAGLTREEREQLFEVVLPETEGLLESALGGCRVNRIWENGGYRLQPLTLDETELPVETSHELFAALLAAAA